LLALGMRCIRTPPGPPSRASTAIATSALPAAPRPHAASSDATDDRLVDLDGAGQPLTIGADHRPTQLVQPRPRRLITAQAEHALQT
jgi:hypothetical protein